MDTTFRQDMSRARELFEQIESIGIEALNKLYIDQKNEELFLDYKQIATTVGQKSLHNNDRANLRKALSGFSNAEGGVILWGLSTGKDNGADHLKEPAPYGDAVAFAALVDDAISGCTVPPVPGVRSLPIIADGGKSGFVATLIPASPQVPHQTADDQRAYYMRAGSSFVRVPHAVLAGMFGRRPAPDIRINQAVIGCNIGETENGHRAIHIDLDIKLNNISSVAARGAYVSWRAHSLGTRFSELKCCSVNWDKWHMNKSGLRAGSVLAMESHRLAPFSTHDAVVLRFSIFGEPCEGISAELLYGCEGAAPRHHRYYLSKEHLKQAIEALTLQLESDHLAAGVNNIGLRILGFTV